MSRGGVSDGRKRTPRGQAHVDEVDGGQGHEEVDCNGVRSAKYTIVRGFSLTQCDEDGYGLRIRRVDDRENAAPMNGGERGEEQLERRRKRTRPSSRVHRSRPTIAGRVVRAPSSTAPSERLGPSSARLEPESSTTRRLVWKGVGKGSRVNLLHGRASVSRQVTKPSGALTILLVACQGCALFVHDVVHRSIVLFPWCAVDHHRRRSDLLVEERREGSQGSAHTFRVRKCVTHLQQSDGHRNHGN
jgi:hypothetical protein